MSSHALAFPTTPLIKDIVRRIVDTAHPERIVLFGSAARGERKATSDMDLLVVVPPGTHRRQTAQKIYVALIGVEFPIDIVVVTSEDIQQYKDRPELVIHWALGEGKTLYAA